MSCALSLLKTYALCIAFACSSPVIIHQTLLCFYHEEVEGTAYLLYSPSREMRGSRKGNWLKAPPSSPGLATATNLELLLLRLLFRSISCGKLNMLPVSQTGKKPSREVTRTSTALLGHTFRSGQSRFEV